MKSPAKLRFPFERVCAVWLALAFVVFGEVTGRAAKILYVVSTIDDPTTPTPANDQEVAARLQSQGHTVTAADDQDPALGDLFAGQDLILISSSVGSGNQPLNSLAISTLQNGRTPIVCYEPGLYDELLFQTATTFGNAAGHTSLAISVANQTHPLAAGKSGTIDIANPPDTAVVSSSAFPLTLGQDAIIIATNATPGVDEGRIAIWAYEKGSRLADNSTVAPGRRVAFFYNATTAPGVYNTNATDLFDAAINWALQPPPNLPILVIWRSPPSQNAVPDASIHVELEDGSTTRVNTSSISFSLNGAAVTPPALVVATTGTVTTVSFTPASPFPAGSSNTVRIVYSDSSVPPQTFTNILKFTVENYVTLTPNMKIPAASIDRNKPGYTIKLRQMETARPGGNTIETARIQLNDGFIDPNTNLPYPDLIDRSQTGFDPGSGFNPDGTFTEAGVINYNQVAPGAAEFGVFRAPDYPDKPIPGIPGTTLSDDNIAMHARTVLELKAGLYRLGVNSDDGFGVTVAANPEDVFALRAGAFDADRGQGTTPFSVAVQEDGLYPFELLWWESAGDAEVEFFSVNRATGGPTLINDAASPDAIKAFRPPASVAGLPTVTSVNPRPGAVSVPRNTTIDITIKDGTAQVVTKSIQLTLNGAQVTPSIAKNGTVTTVSFDPPSDLAPLSLNRVTLAFGDNGSPPFNRTNSWTFTVETSSQFNPPVLSGGLVTISWTGSGILQQSSSLSAPNWLDAPSQSNPQTVAATGTRFYRIKQ